MPSSSFIEVVLKMAIPNRTLPTLRKAFHNACNSDNGVTHGAVIFTFKAGQKIDDIAAMFRLKRGEVEEILRAYMKR